MERDAAASRRYVRSNMGIVHAVAPSGQRAVCGAALRQTNEDYWWRFGGWLAWCRFEHRQEVASNGAYHATTGWSIQR